MCTTWSLAGPCDAKSNCLVGSRVSTWTLTFHHRRGTHFCLTSDSLITKYEQLVPLWVLWHAGGFESRGCARERKKMTLKPLESLKGRKKKGKVKRREGIKAGQQAGGSVLTKKRCVIFLAIRAKAELAMFCTCGAILPSHFAKWRQGRMVKGCNKLRFKTGTEKDQRGS